MRKTYDSDQAIREPSSAAYPALKARFAALAQALDLLAAERKQLDDEIKRRERAVSIEMRVGALSVDDKRVLREIVGA